MPKDKRPAMQFYVGDWMKDPDLRACSLAARGLWIDMLCLMYESPRRGYLLVKDRPASQQHIARMTGGSSEEVGALLKELEDAGVYSRSSDGAVFCRRMVRDEAVAARARANGQKGGNPVLVAKSDKGGVIPDSNPPDKPRDKHFVEDEEEESLSSDPKGSRFMEFVYAYPHDKRGGMSAAMLFWVKEGLEAIADQVFAALAEAKRRPEWESKYALRIDNWLETRPWIKSTAPAATAQANGEADAYFVRQLAPDAVERFVAATKAKHPKYAHWPKSAFVNAPPPEFLEVVRAGLEAAHAA